MLTRLSLRSHNWAPNLNHSLFLQARSNTSRSLLRKSKPADPNVRIYSDDLREPDVALALLGAGGFCVAFPLGFLINGRLMDTRPPEKWGSLITDWGSFFDSHLDLFFRCFIMSWVSIGWTIVCCMGLVALARLPKELRDNSKWKKLISMSGVKTLDLDTSTWMLNIETLDRKDVQVPIQSATVVKENSDYFLTSEHGKFLLRGDANVNSHLFRHLTLTEKPALPDPNEWFDLGPASDYDSSQGQRIWTFSTPHPFREDDNDYIVVKLPSDEEYFAIPRWNNDHDFSTATLVVEDREYLDLEAHLRYQVRDRGTPVKISNGRLSAQLVMLYRDRGHTVAHSRSCVRLGEAFHNPSKFSTLK